MMEENRITVSIHGQLLQWVSDVDSGGFEIRDEEHCPHCGAPSLEQLQTLLIGELEKELMILFGHG
jgi:hypothetical protein